MNVMNIKHYLSAAAALAMFAACSDYDPGISDQAVDLTDAEIETIEEYTTKFIERYGTPAEGHTWGFGAKGSEDEMGTRTVNTNRNNWYRLYQDVISGEQITSWRINTDELPEDIKIPGLPSDVDDRYYIEKDGAIVSYATKEAMQADNTSVTPIGDVTDEEIQYVSEWFRTHKNPGSDTPEFTEFFIQDISQDYDRQYYPNGPAINNTLPVYRNGTIDEEGWFKGGTLDGGTESIVYGMDYFAVKTTEASWEHENNFNAQKTNELNGSNPTNETTFKNRTLKYWTTNGGYTTSFMYYNSDQSQQYENYVLVHLTFKGPRSGKDYDGYYLAFDYQFKDLQETTYDSEGNPTYKYAQLKPDGYYSNWIVKLSPGNPNWKDDNHTWHRVMCEDLGSTDDYDFNDLVYDVYFTGTSASGYTAHIKVQASGGTLPIYVGTYDEDITRESHQILQNGNAKMSGGYYEPVNVAIGVTTAPADEIIFEMKDKSGNWYDATKGTNPDYIPILVTSKDGQRKEASLGRSTFVLLHTSESLVPQKICIDGNLIDATKVRWMKERQQIEGSYKRFDKWVSDGVESEYHYGRTNDWTKDPTNTGLLY